MLMISNTSCFVDDCFIMAQASLSIAKVLKQVLRKYYVANVHSINFSESDIYFGNGLDAKLGWRISRFSTVMQALCDS